MLSKDVDGGAGQLRLHIDGSLSSCARCAYTVGMFCMAKPHMSRFAEDLAAAYCAAVVCCTFQVLSILDSSLVAARARL